MSDLQDLQTSMGIALSLPSDVNSEALDASLGPPTGQFTTSPGETRIVNFLVEDHLFQVPEFQFTIQSTYFWPSLDPVIVRGGAIVLEGVTPAEFSALLGVLYPSPADMPTEEEPTSLHWKSVLKLAFNWRMYGICAKAREALTTMIPVVEQVSLARSYRSFEWLLHSYIYLVMHESCPSEEEAGSLGLEVTLHLCQIRETVLMLLKPYDTPHSPQDATVFDDLVMQGLQYLSYLADVWSPLPVGDLPLGGVNSVRALIAGGYHASLQRQEPVSFTEAAVWGSQITMCLCNARDVWFRRGISSSITEAGGHLVEYVAGEIVRRLRHEFSGPTLLKF